MVFFFSIAFFLGLMALGLGIIFLVWGYRSQGRGTCLAKIFGYIIGIAALIGLFCTISCSHHVWKGGHFMHHAGGGGVAAVKVVKP